ncbi:MAG: hypothetical protein M1565_06945, partial [Actinobacteria bacterium]|nr:hypothetical protein [Actinomycetota bacterium]
LREMPPEGFVALITPLLDAAGLLTAEQAASRHEWLVELAPLVAERIKTLDEVVGMVAFFFTDDLTFDEKSFAATLAKEGAGRALAAVHAALAEIDFTAEAVEAAMRAIPAQLELKPKFVFQATRVAVTGSTISGRWASPTSSGAMITCPTLLGRSSCSRP